MAVCFFNEDFSKLFNCEFEKKKYGIEVSVNYDIHDELIANEIGVKAFGDNTEFAKRDILIIDHSSKKNYFLKDASYNGIDNVYGTPDGGHKTKFYSTYYFANSDYQKLINLSKDSNVGKIKIYSNMINEFIGHPSLSISSNESEYIISLKKGSQKESNIIDRNNIKSIAVGDCCSHCPNTKEHNIKIKYDGYIEIELKEVINYYDVYDYVREMCIFMQLLVPDRFEISKIVVYVSDEQYELSIPIESLKTSSKYALPSINENLLSYLSKCYEKIPYRNSISEIRNIPYIILNTSRNLEDNFLMLYRFIECYYKDKGRHTDFITYSIQKNYKFEISSELEDLVSEIISLRNHYVHNGYFLKNHSLEITYKKIKGKKNPKNHIENNADFDWIYDRTKILYDVVIDIIFSNMLGYENYKFDSHF